MSKINAKMTGKNLFEDCQRVRYMTLEEVFDNIAALERKGMITHTEAFEIAERYANVKPGEIIVPAQLYYSLLDSSDS